MSAKQARLGRQRRRKRATQEDRANPFPVNVLDKDSLLTSVVAEGTCDCLGGSKGPSADTGAVSGQGGSILSSRGVMEGRTTYLMGHSHGSSSQYNKALGGAVAQSYAAFPERSPAFSGWREMGV